MDFHSNSGRALQFLWHLQQKVMQRQMNGESSLSVASISKASTLHVIEHDFSITPLFAHPTT